MPDIITPSAARQHLRLSATVTDEALAPLITAAQGRIEGFLGRELVGETGWATSDAVPAIVVHSVKLALADLYVNREAPELTDDQLRPIIGRHMALSFG